MAIFTRKKLAEETRFAVWKSPCQPNSCARWRVDEEESPDFDPLPEDDEPLVAKPLTESDPEH
jgi:hypothetical protein